MAKTSIPRRAALKLAGITTAAVAGSGVAAASGKKAKVKFNEQEANHGKAVYVKEAKLPDGGFVVVHHLVENEADTGTEPSGAANFQVIGHTPVLREGKYRNLPIRLHEDSHHSLNGPVPADGSGDHVLLAMAHKDEPNANGGADDGEYTFTNGDNPYFDKDGNAVASAAVVTF